MSKPNSFKAEPWASLDKNSDSIFTDDFVHDKLVTVKVSQVASKGTVNLKGAVSKKGEKLQASEEIKLWFPAWNRGGSLYFKSKGNDVKLQYDDGNRNWKEDKGWKLIPFCSIQFNKNLNNIVLKAGASVLAQEWSFGGRLRVALN